MATIKMNFLSKALGRQVSIEAIIPSFSFGDCMNDEHPQDYYQEGMKFQTLWLLHGFSGDEEDYIKFSNIVRYAEAHKVAVIMPAAYNMGYADEAEGAKYMSFVAKELPAVCQAFFPLSTKREDNFIGGLSMGANGAMKIGLAYPEQYSCVLCMSGATGEITGSSSSVKWFGNSPEVFGGVVPGRELSRIGTLDDSYFTAKRNLEEGREVPEFFMSIGDQDFLLEMVRKNKDYLMDLGYKVLYEEVEGYGHQWEFWDLTLEKALNKWLPLKNSPIYK